MTDAATARPGRTPLLSIALVSAAALAYEVLLIRLLSIVQWHHFASVIISLALLGLGASGAVLTLARPWLLARFERAYVTSLAGFGATSLACYALAQRVPVNGAELLWDARQPWLMLCVYLLLAVPFGFAGCALGLALTRYRMRIASVYGADLLGAGVGGAAMLGLLYLVFPGTAVQAVAAVGLAAAAVASVELRMASWRLGALSALAALTVFGLPSSWSKPVITPYKGLPLALEARGAQVVKERSSPLGLVSVVENSTVPFRGAPGLSLRAFGEPPEQLGIFIDGEGPDVINRFPFTGADDFLTKTTSALPYVLRPPERVLLLGLGGGTDVLRAQRFGATRIEAVELDSQRIALLARDFRDFSGALLDGPDREIHLARRCRPTSRASRPAAI
jgi:hypothetical protein